MTDDAIDVDTYDGRSMKVCGFETMSDEITGTGEWGGFDGAGMRKSSALDSQSIPWVIIADDRAAYYFCAYTKTDGILTSTDYSIASYFFGDGIPFVEGDTHFVLIFGGADSTDSFFGATKAINYDKASYHYMWRDLDLANHGGGCCLIGASPSNGGAMGGGVNLFTHPFYGETVFTIPYVNNGTSYSIRGLLPGLKDVRHLTPFDNLELIDIDGEEHFAIRALSYINVFGQILINVSTGFRP